MGGMSDLQKEIQDAEKPEAEWHGGWEHQEACLTVQPGEDGALPYRAVSPLDLAGPRAFLEPAWSGLGRPAGRRFHDPLASYRTYLGRGVDLNYN